MSSVRIASRLSRRSSRSRTTRSKRRCPTQICDASSPTRPIRTARITSPGASPTRAVACAVDRDLQLRQAGQLLGAQIGDARRRRA